MSDTKDFYSKLKNDLNETTEFPSKYLYKFIIPSDEEKIKQVEGLFNFEGAVINKNESKTGKFTSISVEVIMQSADAVIEKYKEAGKIEGIISL
jgi:putative lipoic acid-binding regulatory protein